MLPRLVGEELSWVGGGLIGMAASVWLFLDVGSFYLQYGIYMVAALLGGASSILLITRFGQISSQHFLHP